jgi:hypothetical protein
MRVTERVRAFMLTKTAARRRIEGDGEGLRALVVANVEAGVLESKI